MAKYQRQLSGTGIQDPSIISNLQYSSAAGSQKVSEVGKRLIPIPLANGTFTTNTTTVTTLPMTGANLAFYNNSGAVASATVGNANTISSLAPGVTDANGNVGVPLMPNSWTYLACGVNQFVISSASTVLTFIIEDVTYVVQEAKTFQGN